MTTPQPRTNPAALTLADTALHLTLLGFPAAASNPGGFCDTIDVTFACGTRAMATDIASSGADVPSGWSVCVHDGISPDTLADVSTADGSIDGLVALLLFGLSQSASPAAGTTWNPR